MAALHVAGITTYAFVGPLLPHFRFEPQQLDDLFRLLSQAGVTSVYVEHMNLKGYIRQRMLPLLEVQPSNVKEAYDAARHADHLEALDKIVSALLKKHGLRLRMNHVLRHV